MQQQPWHRKTFPSSEAEPPSHRASGSTANLQATHPPVTSQFLPFLLLISRKYPAKTRDNLKSTFQPRKAWSALSQSDCKKGENKDLSLVLEFLLTASPCHCESADFRPAGSKLRLLPEHLHPAWPDPGNAAQTCGSLLLLCPRWTGCRPPQQLLAPTPCPKCSWSSSGSHSWQHQALRTLNFNNHLPPGVFEAELRQILSWTVNKEWSIILEKELLTLTASIWQELISKQQKTPLFQRWIHGGKLIPSTTPLPSTEIH